MKRHFLGTIIFSLIVGTAIFVSEYFAVLPNPSEIFETSIDKTISHENVSPITSNVKIKQAVFDSKTQTIRLKIKETVWKKADIDEKLMAHFFTTNNGMSQFIITQEFFPGPVANWTIYTHAVKVENLSKLNSLQNIYVIAESDRNYNKNSTPIFNPEMAVPILIDKGKN